MAETEKLRRAGARQLKAAGIESAALDARLLLQGLFGISHAALVSGRARALTAAEAALYRRALARRAAHEPAHRILGRRAFYGRDFILSPGTLEPRPDTEALIDLLLPYIRKKADENAARQKAPPAAAPPSPPDKGAGSFAPQKAAGVGAQGANREKEAPPAAAPITLLDIGAGSGIIALTLLAEEPRLHACGADISADALKTARQNAKNLGAQARFRAVKSDCFSAFGREKPQRFDFIVSNPPYIPSGEIAALAPEVRDYDPVAALDGGADGLKFYRILAAEAGAHLAAGGKIAVEIGFGQAAAVEAVFAAAGFRLLASRRDLSGAVRALLFAPAETPS